MSTPGEHIDTWAKTDHVPFAYLFYPFLPLR